MQIMPNPLHLSLKMPISAIFMSLSPVLLYSFPPAMAETSYQALKPHKGLISGLQDLFSLHNHRVLFVITVVYAAQGLRTLGSSAVFFYFKEDLGVKEESSAQVLIATTYLPWYIKPVYGLISDSLPIYGSHRKAYLLLSAAFGAVAYLAFLAPLSLTTTMICLICGQLSQVVADIIADALMVVESRTDTEYGSSFLQAYSWSVMSIVSLLGGVVGWYLSYVGVEPSTVLASLAVAPLCVIVAGIGYNEPEKDQFPRFKETVSGVISALSQKSTYQSLLFLYLILASVPGISQVWKYFLTNELHFSNHFLYLISGASGLSYLTAAAIFSHWLKNWTLRKVLLCGQILLICCCLLDFCLVCRYNRYLYLPDELFYAGSAYIAASISGAFILFPSLVIAAQLCPHNLEATMYALVSSVSNFGGYTSELFGSALTQLVVPIPGQYEDFYMFSLLQMAFMVVPLTLLGLLPKGTRCSEQGKGD